MTRPSVLVPLQAEIASSCRPACHASYPRPENVGQKTMPVFRFSSSSVSRSDRANSSQATRTVLQAGPKQKRRACKPGSVPRAPVAPTIVHHLSGPAVAGRLLQPTRRLEFDSWTGRPPAARLCSWRGLPCRRRRRRRGGLLPHLFTLTGRRTAQPQATGSMFSVALSVRVACRRRGPGVTRRHALMEPGLSSASAARGDRPAAVHRPASHFRFTVPMSAVTRLATRLPRRSKVRRRVPPRAVSRRSTCRAASPASRPPRPPRSPQARRRTSDPRRRTRHWRHRRHPRRTPRLLRRTRYDCNSGRT